MTLSLRGIEKSFGPTKVLRGVTLDVKAGEVHALLGENGAGKSTLMRIVLGLERAEAGAMTLASEPYAPRDAREARARGVVMVPQERTLCPHLSVGDNLRLGMEPWLMRRQAERGALEARIDLGTLVRDLSVADQQLVEIARALAQGEGHAKVLVLDEPTASLGKDDADRLFARVSALRETGLAIILVTHFLGDVRAHADRYTVLRDGAAVGHGDARVTPPEQIVHEMLGRELEATLADRDETTPGELLLEVRDVAGAVKPASATFELRRGEILGIAGLVGAGRTELLRVIAGLDTRRVGTVRAHGGVGLLSEDRGGEGLMLKQSIAENIALSARGPRFVSPRETLLAGARWVTELAIRAHSPAQRAEELSGGNQQKVQIARLLREDYDVLLVDEPTRGIDVGSKAQVLALLRELAAKGKGIVLVSSQLDELVSTCDRICVLRRGRLGEARPARAWDEASLLLEAAS